MWPASVTFSCNVLQYDISGNKVSFFRVTYLVSEVLQHDMNRRKFVRKKLPEKNTRTHTVTTKHKFEYGTEGY